MKTFSRICLVAAVVCSMAFVTAPGANAALRGDSQTEAGTESGWLGAAFDWLQSLLGSGERRSDRRVEKSTSKPISQYNGSCIDPQGRTRPWCAP